jgi:chaperonin GroES
MKLSAKLSLEKIQDSSNLCKSLSEEDLRTIGDEVVKSYEIDKTSRRKWEIKMQDAMELALQLAQPKTYPWPKASNVKFPLLTIASMQFAARAYPALVKAPDLVKFRQQGKDPDGQKASRALRISSHMSYQLLEQDESWEEEQDKAFLALPILGCVFKKSYYDAVLEHNRSRLVLPKSLVVHYFAKSIEEAERKTEVFQLYEREVRERELRGIFKENDYGPTSMPAEREEDDRQGLSAPFNDEDSPRTFLEQHRYLDLDGDGYREPYVVTVDKDTKLVARIVARIESVVTEQSIKIDEIQKQMRSLAEGVQQSENPTPQEVDQLLRIEQTLIQMKEEVERLAAQKPKVVRIVPVEHYTKYSFIPSPDGGFYDLGFGALLSPLNDSVNTLINQLIDSGSMQNSSSGFIGKGARIKGGKLRFSPNEWKRVNVAGSTLRDAIVPLPVNQPSNVLFQLLSLLITYSERVGSVTDAMVGENPGQNTPAYNMSAMLEQGLQVFNGIFKRVYRSFRSEIRKLYQLNSIYLDETEYFTYQDSDNKALRVDYTADAKDLIPAADPNAFSSKEKLTKAQAVVERAQMTPGYDPIKAELRFLEALDIPDVAEVFPLVPEVNPETGEETGGMTYKFPPQPDPEFEIKRAEEERRSLEAKVRGEVTMAEADAKLMVAEADVILKMAQASKIADEPELERLKLIAKEISDKRKALVEVVKVEQSDKQAADRRVD